MTRESPLPPSKPSSDPFADPVWNALRTAHRPLSLSQGRSCKYPANVAPFAAVEANTAEALADLHALMQPGEYTWLYHEPPAAHDGLAHEATMAVLQMVFPAEADPPIASSDAKIVPLDASHGPEMVALTDVAFPGFFRAEIYRMGSYFGIRDDAGKLVAMCGERLIAAAEEGVVWREISGLCTHPEHRGHGYGTLLLRRLIEFQRSLGAVSLLHVAADNTNAIALYRHLGFHDLRAVTIHKVLRTD